MMNRAVKDSAIDVDAQRGEHNNADSVLEYRDWNGR
jgi:hypothetical protein